MAAFAKRTRQLAAMLFSGEPAVSQAIDAAIARGLARVEAGAQGEHKLARGYEPVATWSAGTAEAVLVNDPSAMAESGIFARNPSPPVWV